MVIYPAIDLKGGKCVRLRQGRREDETVFSEDPAAVARKWAAAGAEYLHVVDLDGAFEHAPRNQKSIASILEQVDVPVQLGGGIRDEATIESFLDLGVERVIMGTRALQDPRFVRSVCRRHPGRMVIGIDAKKGRVAIHGWTRTSDIQASEMARRFEDCGAAAIVFTDIQRDGMLSGPNIEATRAVAETVSIPVIASGGVSSMKDICDLMALETAGVKGIITGKALYSGALRLEEILAATRSNRPAGPETQSHSAGLGKTENKH
jgi:phosphoribosylformimino-5-aminoimidazole carboxamide ribotide isomerase